MISEFYNIVYKFWLNKEDLKELPLSITDLKLVELIKNKIKEGNLEKRNSIYVLNRKTNNLYRPFSFEIDKSYKTNSFLKIELDLQKLYSIKCQKIFIQNFPEAICKIFKAPVYIIWQSLESLRKGEPALAVLSSIMLAIGQFIEIFRLIHYSFGVQIAALEGLLFDPIKGVFVIELMEKKLNRGLDNKSDPLYKFSRNKIEIDDYLHHWYIDRNIINCDHLNAKIEKIDSEVIKKFEILKEKEFLVSSKPDLFPLVHYLTFQIKEISQKVQKFAIDFMGGNYEFSNLKSWIAFKRGSK